jgi:hypothetical protein
MSTNAAKLVEAITNRLERGLQPLVARVKALEERDQRINALEARLARLEAARAEGDGEVIEAER